MGTLASFSKAIPLEASQTRFLHSFFLSLIKNLGFVSLSKCFYLKHFYHNPGSSDLLCFA